jgi:transcriptional regulator GlxA family with amidase domain
MQINGELARNADVRRQDLESLCRRKALGFELASVVASLATIRQERSGIFYGAERLQSVLRYIEGHIDGDLSRTRLAYILSLSPSRFYAVFEAALGVGPNAYVQQRRMERAQQLLITTSLSVSEVGRACGYEDQFVFSRIFKKLFGLSPLQYRRQIQQDYGNA